MDCTLGKGDLLRLKGRSGGMVLHCLRGTVWVTNGNGVDYLVHEGNLFRLDPAATAVVEALGSAQVHLESVACEAAGPRPNFSLTACRAGN